MGKSRQHQNTGISIESNHPRCMWNILHVLHYSRWNHFRKKLVPHRRHGGGRQSTGVGNSENDTNAPDAETNIPLIEEKETKPTRVTRSSMKSRIKAILMEEISKRMGQHRRSSSYPTLLQLTRTDSIHHIAPSYLSPLEVALSDANPRIVHQENGNSASRVNLLQSKAYEEPVTSNEKCVLCAAILAASYTGLCQCGDHRKQPVGNDTLLQDKLNEAKQGLSAQRLSNAKESNKDVSSRGSKQFQDALNVFDMNKELLLKVIQDPSSPLAHYLYGRPAFNLKREFTKSMSFPLPGPSHKRDIEPSKLKQEPEPESCAEGDEKTQEGSGIQKSAELECTEDIHESSMSLMAESSTDGVPKPYMANLESLDNSSTGLLPGPKNRKGNEVVIKHFKNLKTKLKHAIREHRKDRRICMDAVLHKIPYGRKFSKDGSGEIVDFWKDTAMAKSGKSSPQSSSENDGKCRSEHSGRRYAVESLDRYCRLYESSFNTEANHHMSERLKSRTDETPLPSGTTPKTLVRIHSLPDLRSYCYLRLEVSPDTISGKSFRTTNVNGNVVSNRLDERRTSSVPSGSENETLSDAPVETGSQNNLVELGESNAVANDEVGSRSLGNGEEGKMAFTPDDLGSSTAAESDARHENEIQATLSPVTKLEEPSHFSNLGSSQEDLNSPTKFSLSEDSRLQPWSLFSDGESMDSFANEQQETMDSPILAESREGFEKRGTSIEESNSEFLRVLVETKDIAEFNFVKYVLDLSGFSRNELLGAWHSPDQPIDPSMFEELEDFLLPEPVYSENEGGNNCNRLLLFNLISEVLLEIYERSFTYIPMPLSATSHIHPVPVGSRVLEEVWANISRYLSWKPETDLSLDDTVSRDLSKFDGWMNLQFEAESVGIELEDMVFDDLLDELIGLDELLAAKSGAPRQQLAYT